MSPERLAEIRERFSHTCTWCGHADHGEKCTDSIIVADVTRKWKITETAETKGKSKDKVPTKQISCPCVRGPRREPARA